MGWVRLEDTFCEHPKVETLDDLPFRLHIKAICYANRNLTDGFIPVVAARAMGGPRYKRATKALMTAGLWELARDGFRIHDYLDFQPARQSVLLRRESDRNRKGIRAPRTQPRTQVSIETGTEDRCVTDVLERTSRAMRMPA